MINKIELLNVVVYILCMFKFVMPLKKLSSNPWIIKKYARRLCLCKVINRLLADLYNTLGIFLGHVVLNMCHPPFSSAYKLSSI